MNDKDYFIFIGERLREERKRLDITQESLSQITSSTKPTVISWEKGNSTPNAGVLTILSQYNFDIFYIITGQRTPVQMAALSMEETYLIDNYRNSAEEGRKALEATSAAVAKPKKDGQIRKRA